MYLRCHYFSFHTFDKLPNHIITQYGDILNLKNLCWLDPIMNEFGYWEVFVDTEFQTNYKIEVNKLLCFMIFGSYYSSVNRHVNHMDGNKSNTYIGNLQWAPIEYLKQYETQATIQHKVGVCVDDFESIADARRECEEEAKRYYRDWYEKNVRVRGTHRYIDAKLCFFNDGKWYPPSFPVPEYREKQR